MIWYFVCFGVCGLTRSFACREVHCFAVWFGVWACWWDVMIVFYDC